MRNLHSQLWWSLFLVVCAPAQGSSLTLIGQNTPAASASPAPQAVVLNALSDDGLHLVLTAARDHWAAQDLNSALDVLALDRGTAEPQSVSTNSRGFTADRTSCDAGASVDGSRIVYQSRATDLIAGDSNGTWDVFLHDRARALTLLVSAATNGNSGSGPSENPAITPDGRYVLFESEADDLAPIPPGLSRGLFRRDLASGQTLHVSQDLAPLTTSGVRTIGGRLTPDGRFAAFVAATGSSALFVRDLVQATTWHVSALSPPDLPAGARVDYASPVLSDDGSKVACLATPLHGDRPRGILYYDREAATCLWVLPPSTLFPASLDARRFPLGLSTDGRALAFVYPVQAGGATLLQVYHWDAQQAAAPRLVSAGWESGEPATANATQPRLSPDGRWVAYLSAATNLLAEADSPALRAYLWDRDTETTRVIGAWPDPESDGTLAMSAGGAWVAACGPTGADGASISLTECASGTSESMELAAAAVTSASPAGWIAVDTTAGVSFDGRYVAAIALPNRQSAAPAQVYRIDTETGIRELISAEPGGASGWGNSVPQISSDGLRIAYTSFATNLVAGDVDNLRDLFVFDVPTAEHRRVRYQPADTAGLERGFRLSPNGRYLQFSYSGSSRRVCVADLDSGVVAALPGSTGSTPAFSATGEWLALPLSSVQSTADASLQLVHVPELIAGGSSAAVRWSEALSARTVALSPDGQCLAYLASTHATLRIITWATQSLRLEHSGAFIADLILGDNGSHAAWAESTLESIVTQITLADLETAQSSVASVAPDGTTPGDDNSRYPAFSPDGHYLAFASYASNLAPAGPVMAKQVFLRDLRRGRTLLITQGLSGLPGNRHSTRPFFSGDGQSLFFVSHAANLVAGDLNGVGDLFKVTTLPSPEDIVVVLRRSVFGGPLTLLWNGTPGQRYQVETRGEFGPGAWEFLAEIDGAQSSLDVPAGPGPSRYFRVVLPVAPGQLGP